MTTGYINQPDSLTTNKKVLIDTNVLLEFCLCDYRCKSWSPNNYFLKIIELVNNKKFLLTKEVAEEFQRESVCFTTPKPIEYWVDYKYRYPQQLKGSINQSPKDFKSITKTLTLNNDCEALVKEVIKTKEAIKRVQEATSFKYDYCREVLQNTSFNVQKAIASITNYTSKVSKDFSTTPSLIKTRIEQKYNFTDIDKLVGLLTSTLKSKKKKNQKTDALLTLYAVLGNFDISTSDRAIIHSLKEINKEKIVVRPHFLINY